MALIKSVRGLSPKYGSTCWFADNATVVGEVIMGEHCTVWFNAVVRGDVNTIQMGDYVNIQDGAVIHCTYQKSKTIIGNHVSIAHNAIVHGCTIEDKVLIGMDGQCTHRNGLDHCRRSRSYPRKSNSSRNDLGRKSC